MSRLNRNIPFTIPNCRIDERDTMFARMARKSGTPQYEDYYNTNPELKVKDDYLRSLPPLLQTGGKYFDSKITIKTRELFKAIDKIQINEDQLKEFAEKINSSNNTKDSIKIIINEIGAVAVGITDLNPTFLYSKKGRFDDEYGKDIILDHPNIILFLVEMNYANMQCAPKAETIYESANQYYNAAFISKMVEKLIIDLGYKAKAHYDAHYDVILPPLAVKAGLGELGRNNILIADKYGSRVRIGAVSTDLPLEHDKVTSLGAEKFCEVCKKCADNCPSKALNTNGKSDVNGIYKWPTNVEKCYTIWRKYGTDCGICMAICPFSHNNNFLHNSIRMMVKRIPILNSFLVKMDDLIYGKKWKN